VTTPLLFRERLARWLVDVTLEAAGHGGGRPDEPGAEPAERPTECNSADSGPRPVEPPQSGHTPGAA